MVLLVKGKSKKLPQNQEPGDRQARPAKQTNRSSTLMGGSVRGIFIGCGRRSITNLLLTPLGAFHKDRWTGRFAAS